MPIHVAVCFEFASINGGENSLLTLVPLLRSQGITLTAVAPQIGPLADQLATLEMPVVGWGTDAAGEPLRGLPARRGSLAAAIRAVNPDLVHANSLSTSRAVGPLLGRPVALSPGIAHSLLAASGVCSGGKTAPEQPEKAGWTGQLC